MIHVLSSLGIFTRLYVRNKVTASVNFDCVHLAQKFPFVCAVAVDFSLQSRPASCATSQKPWEFRPLIVPLFEGNKAKVMISN
jgi:hypothetical protein